MRIAFFGTPEFAAHILEELIAAGENVVVVVTPPDKQQGRGLKVRSSAVKEAAVKHNIPVLTPAKLRDEAFLNELKAFEADIFCVVAYRILPREVFSIPPLGSFNIHASLLPKYRGAAPINWAIINGEKETGITSFLLDDKVDTGRMLIQERIPIGENETAGEVHDRLMILGADIAVKTIRGLGDGSLRGKPQNDEEATPAPKIFPPDCVIDFNQPAEQVHNFIRGMSPHPGAVTTVKDARLKILRSQVSSEDRTLSAGKFAVSEDGKLLFVGSSTKPLEILELQREGKRPMHAEEFLRGARGLF